MIKIRAVVQRVKNSSVLVNKQIVAEINNGLNVLLGFNHEDTKKDIEWLINKIINLRIFNDSENKLNLSLLDVKGDLLIVPQFTLYGDCRKGRRPSFCNAASLNLGKKLFETTKNYVQDTYPYKTGFGIFQASMEVTIINDGPVTLIIDSPISNH